MNRDRDGSPDLGRCCACGRRGRSVRNILMLDQVAPVPGKGWGCVQCGLEPDGAIAVVCDRCLEEKRPLVHAVSGYPKEDDRVPIGSLSGHHAHRMELHPEAGSEEGGPP